MECHYFNNQSLDGIWKSDCFPLNLSNMVGVHRPKETHFAGIASMPFLRGVQLWCLRSTLKDHVSIFTGPIMDNKY